MITNKDIIIVGLQPWDNEIGSNCKNIAIEFAKHNRVLYVNHPMDRITLYRQKNKTQYKNHVEILEKKKNNIVQEGENLWNLYPKNILESANWIPSTFIFILINKINNKRFTKDIKIAIDKLQFTNYLLFNDSDMFRSFHLKELLAPTISIYYTRDNLMGVPYWFKHGKKMEPELFAKSDLVVANSTYLADVAREHNPSSFYVGQGCDVEDFDVQKIKEIPSDMAQVKSPVIGYIGTLFNLRLHLELLQELARKKQEWNFVFVGPEDEKFKNSLLHKLPNVFFLGLKEAKQLPGYLSCFDVAINPQKINEVTIGNYPRKIDEYLAMGKPVVATETAAMNIFKSHVYFASTVEEYIDKIKLALEENNSAKEKSRMEFARSHTWENSVSEIYRAIVKAKPELAAKKENFALTKVEN